MPNQALTRVEQPVNRSRNNGREGSNRAPTTALQKVRRPPRFCDEPLRAVGDGEKGREREQLSPLQPHGARRPRHRNRGDPLHRPRRAVRLRRARGGDWHDGARTPVPRSHRLGRSRVRPQLQPLRPGSPLFVLRPRRRVRAARDHDSRRWRPRVQVARREVLVEQGRQDADDQPPQGRQVVGRQAADRRRRRLQHDRRQAGPDDGHPRHDPRGNEHRRRAAEGHLHGPGQAEDA